LMTLGRPSWSPPPFSRLASSDLTLPHRLEPSKRRVAGAMAAAGQGLAWRTAGGSTVYGAGYRLGSTRWLVAMLPFGLLVLGLAFGVYEAYGWNGAPQNLVVGEERYLDAKHSMTVFLDELVIIPDAEGSIQSLSSRLSVTASSQPAVTLTLGAGERASVGDVAIYALGYGPAARVQARTVDGHRLELRQLLGDPRQARVVRVAFVDEQQEKWLAVPDQSLLIRMLYYAQTPQRPEAGQAASSEPSIHVQVIRGRDGQVLEELFLQQGEQIEAENLVLGVDFEYYITVQGRREPHLPIAALGAALAVLGLISWIVWPPREAWVVLQEDEERNTRGQLCVRARQAQSDWFGCVQAMLREETDFPSEMVTGGGDEPSEA
ncbi:MAG: hypothetical protein JXA74_13060, partial [Anaerolineae bacterium]|nr:hypothetical protein [Anaerolineae bacterium]